MELAASLFPVSFNEMSPVFPQHPYELSKVDTAFFQLIGLQTSLGLLTKGEKEENQGN